MPMINSLLEWKHNNVYGLNATIDLIKEDYRLELYRWILIKNCESDIDAKRVLEEFQIEDQYIQVMLYTKKWFYRLRQFIGCFRNSIDLLNQSLFDPDKAIELLNLDISYISGIMKFIDFNHSSKKNLEIVGAGRAYGIYNRMIKYIDERPFYTSRSFDRLDWTKKMNEYLVHDWKRKMHKQQELFYDKKFEEIRSTIFAIIEQYISINCVDEIDLDSSETYYGISIKNFANIQYATIYNPRTSYRKLLIDMCHSVMFKHNVDLNVKDEVVVKELEEVAEYSGMDMSLYKNAPLDEKLYHYIKFGSKYEELMWSILNQYEF